MQLPTGSAKITSGWKAASRPAASTKSEKRQQKHAPANSSADIPELTAICVSTNSLPLVVENEGDARTFRFQQLGCSKQQRRLARPQKAADEREYRHTRFARLLR